MRLLKTGPFVSGQLSTLELEQEVEQAPHLDVAGLAGQEVAEARLGVERRHRAAVVRRDGAPRVADEERELEPAQRLEREHRRVRRLVRAAQRRRDARRRAAQGRR